MKAMMRGTLRTPTAERAEGLAEIIFVAARLGDAHGDEGLALTAEIVQQV